MSRPEYAVLVLVYEEMSNREINAYLYFLFMLSFSVH